MKKITALLSLLFITNLLFSQSVATYDISFQSTWNASEHSSIPNNAHWSNLVGATHNAPNEFVELEQNATLGIKDVAELGSNTAFENEVNAAINQDSADQWLQQGFAPFNAISSATLTDVEVSENYPLLTLVSMVAPSPDWFIAINSLNLRNDENDEWKDTFTMDVFVYDAGTDSGTNYGSSNNPNSPVPVSMITGFPINGNKIGTLTVTLKSILSRDTPNFNQNIRVFPNPSNGKISIKNNTGTSLNKISIYNILGSQVKVIELSDQRNINLNLTNLKKGVYLARIESVNGQVKTQKLIIQ